MTSTDDGAHEFSIEALDATTVVLSAVDGTLFRMGDGEDTDPLLLATSSNLRIAPVSRD